MFIVQVVWLVYYDFSLNISIWENTPRRFSSFPHGIFPVLGDFNSFNSSKFLPYLSFNSRERNQIYFPPPTLYLYPTFFHNYLRGGGNLFRRIIYHIHGQGKWFPKNCISFLYFEEIIVIGYNFCKFSSQFYGAYFCFKKISVLFNNEHLN